MAVKVCILTNVHSPLDQRIFHKEGQTLAAAGYDVTIIGPGHASVSGPAAGLRIETIDPPRSVVWEMNGDVLPSKHGFPVRLINPGHYGQKMPKWITRIELIDEEYLGYWESKPENRVVKWSDDAIATVNSRIDAPISIWDDVKDPGNGGVVVTLQRIVGREGDTFTIHGIAMAGERSVQQFEISTNGGLSWTDAHIMTTSEPNVWSTWSYEWPLPPSGRYEIVVRATDSEGVRQPPEDRGNDVYDGRTGWHRVAVNVTRSSSG